MRHNVGAAVLLKVPARLKPDVIALMDEIKEKDEYDIKGIMVLGHTEEDAVAFKYSHGYGDTQKQIFVRVEISEIIYGDKCPDCQKFLEWPCLICNEQNITKNCADVVTVRPEFVVEEYGEDGKNCSNCGSSGPFMGRPTNIGWNRGCMTCGHIDPIPVSLGMCDDCGEMPYEDFPLPTEEQWRKVLFETQPEEPPFDPANN